MGGVRGAADQQMAVVAAGAAGHHHRVQHCQPGDYSPAGQSRAGRPRHDLRPQPHRLPQLVCAYLLRARGELSFPNALFLPLAPIVDVGEVNSGE